MKTYLVLGLILLLAGCASGVSGPQQELADTYYNLGNAHMRLGEYSRAVRAYQRSLEIMPSQYEASYNLASAWAAQDEYPRALIQIEQLLEADPLHTHLLETAAWLHLQLGRAEKALGLYRRAAEADPGDMEIRRNIIKVLMDLEAYPQARDDAYFLLELGGADQAVLMMLYEIDVHLGREHPEVWLQEAWKRYPGEAEIAEPLFRHYAGELQESRAAGVLSVLIDHEKAAEAVRLIGGVEDPLLSEGIQEALPEEQRSALADESTK